jgi:hypothetical protein
LSACEHTRYRYDIPDLRRVSQSNPAPRIKAGRAVRSHNLGTRGSSNGQKPVFLSIHDAAMPYFAVQR